MNNRDRADRFATVLGAVASIMNSSDEHATLVDLLADAMHWADANREDFHFALAQACRHYIHELNDDQQDERRL